MPSPASLVVAFKNGWVKKAGRTKLPVVILAVMVKELAGAGIAPGWDQPPMVVSPLVSAGSGLIG